jgi:uncharacterized surface protein with fasciclin (FAS1) repeats
MQQQCLGKLASAGLLTFALVGALWGASLAAAPATASAASRDPAEQPAAASEPATTSPAPAAAPTPGGKPAPTRDIVDTLAGDEHFATLAEALRTAGLTQLLRSKGPYTFFAPTEEAWKKLPSGAREELLAQPARLKAVLTYHILKGRVDNVGLHKLRNALTMGGIVTIDYVSGVKVSGGVVTRADIACRNGIVHAVDKVLMPVSRPGPRVAPGGKAAAHKTAARGRTAPAAASAL